MPQGKYNGDNTMIYMIGLVAIIVIFGLLPEQYGLRQKNYKSYLILCGIIIALLTGLRTQHTGSGDTYAYAFRYTFMQKYDSFGEFYDVYLSDSNLLVSESGFYFSFWLLGRVFQDPQVMIFVTSAFITFATCRFIYKNSSEGFLPLLMYICLGLFTFNMNGLRQALSMSICLFAYERAKKRKLISFILIVLLSMQFHKTAVCFFPVYFLPIIKPSKNNIILFIGAMMVFLLAIDQVILTYNQLSAEEYNVGDEASGGGLFVVLLYIFGIIMAFLQPDMMRDRISVPQICAVLAGLAAYIARYFSNQMMERISHYYFYFLILLIPNALGRLEGQEAKIIRWLFIVFAAGLFLYRIFSGSFKHFELFFFA